LSLGLFPSLLNQKVASAFVTLKSASFDSFMNTHHPSTEDPPSFPPAPPTYVRSTRPPLARAWGSVDWLATWKEGEREEGGREGEWVRVFFYRYVRSTLPPLARAWGSAELVGDLEGWKEGEREGGRIG